MSKFLEKVKISRNRISGKKKLAKIFIYLNTRQTNSKTAMANISEWKVSDL